ncbi:MAG: T9SS type A sorting domain-containing protein [Saprospiraceae bacterium]|nr:T9SS type A sorting domain-containing protein [Saprospiraceae bacterium]MDW8484997.1 T9SS type A sorting domain-containing protein [Saprospiraceae bacterium]
MLKIDKIGYTLALCCTLAQAQTPFSAADFTATDVNGRTWNLYQLLSNGNAVLLHFMTTYCMSCWAYHQSKTLHTLYQQHGPDGGTNRVKIFLVESDPATSVNCLYGLSGCNYFTPGNWTSNTFFPILNDHTLASKYNVSEYPTLILVCPNRKAYRLRPTGAAELFAYVQDCPVALGQHNAALFDFEPGSPWSDVCTSIALHPRVRLVNLGKSPLQKSYVGLFWQNELLQTVSWQGILTTYQDTLLSFAPQIRNDSGILQVRILSFNGGAHDADSTNNYRAHSFGKASQNEDHAFLLKIRTDHFGAETYWELRDEQGHVLRSGGNLLVGPNGGGLYPSVTGGPGAYSDNATIYDTLYLPKPGCYTLHFVDAYGDGMCCANGQGYFQLYRLRNPLDTPILSGGRFGAYDRRRFNTNASTTSNPPSDTKETTTLHLWPNPAIERLFIQFTWDRTESLKISIVDMLGRPLKALPPVPAVAHEPVTTTVEPLALPSGVYWLRICGPTGETITHKFAVMR